MKKLTWTIAFIVMGLWSHAQFDEWLGIMHGNQFYYTPEFGACEFDNPFQQYAYNSLPDDYCTSVSSNGLPDNRMESIYISPDGEVIIGTFSGLAVLNPDQSWETYNFKTSEIAAPGPVEAVFKDSEGIYWISLEGGGIYSLDPSLLPGDAWQFYPVMAFGFQGTAFTFQEDFVGDIWACGSFGIGHFDRDQDAWTLRNSTNSALTIGNYRDFVFDENFNIWAAHEWDGLVFFNPGTVQVTKYNTSNSDLPSDFLTSLYFEEADNSADNRIWYGSADIGFGYFQPNMNSFVHYNAADYPDFFSGAVMDIARSPQEGAFWLSTSAGVTRFENNQFTTFNPSNNGFHSFQANDIAIDPITGQVWALSPEDGPGIYYPWEAWGRLDQFNNGALNTNSFRKVAISPSGEAWVIGRDNPGMIGVFRSNVLRNVSFRETGLRFITNDITFRGNLAYVATDDGIWSFDYRLFSDWKHDTNNGDLDEVVAIETGPDQNIWICTKNGLFKFDGTTYTEYNTFNSNLPDNHVTHVSFEPGTGAVWVGTNAGGFARMNENEIWDQFFNTNTSIISSNQIWELYWDPFQGTIWAATEGGLFSYNVAGQTSINWPAMTQSPLGSRFRTVIVDMDGQVYAGSLAGFGKLNVAMVEWEVFDATNSALGDNSVNDIAIDSEGRKWIIGFSSTKGGLFRYDDEGPGIMIDQQIIEGSVYFDANGNNINEPQFGDHPLEWINFKAVNTTTGTSYISPTGADGKYRFSLTEPGDYEISVSVPDNYLPSGTTTFNYTFDPFSNNANPEILNPVGLRPLDINRPDYQIDVTSFKMRCNEYVWVDARIVNTGEETATPEVNFLFNENVFDFSAAFPQESGTNGNVVTIYPGSIAPGSHRDVTVVVTPPSEVFTGQTVCFSVEVSETFNNVFIEEVFNHCDLIFCGFDPNDKLVSPSGVGDNNDTHPDSTLTYTVRFQNTGNDYAYNVSIADTLDPNLDIESFQMISSSHPVLLDILPGNVLNFSFPGIMLPDSATSWNGSQGYVKYSIKVRSDIENNTLVTNTAYITFDQNAPIQTNTVSNNMTTLITSIEATPETEVPNLLIAPNPAGDHTWLEISNLNTQDLQIDLYNMLGRKVRTYSGITSSRFKLERGDLLPGVYTIDVISNNGRLSGKIIFH